MTLLKSWLFYLVLALIAGIPLAYWFGKQTGATLQREATELAALVSTAKNDTATSAAIAKLTTQYNPVYIEVEKYHDAPKCSVPAVIRDTIAKLPGNTYTAH